MAVLEVEVWKFEDVLAGLPDTEPDEVTGRVTVTFLDGITGGIRRGHGSCWGKRTVWACSWR